jgi:hypothetical protein
LRWLRRDNSVPTTVLMIAATIVAVAVATAATNFQSLPVRLSSIPQGYQELVRQ